MLLIFLILLVLVLILGWYYRIRFWDLLALIAIVILLWLIAYRIRTISGLDPYAEIQGLVFIIAFTYLIIWAIIRAVQNRKKD